MDGSGDIALAFATRSAQKLADCRKWIKSEPEILSACGSVIRRNRFGDSTLRKSTLAGSAYEINIMIEINEMRSE